MKKTILIMAMLMMASPAFGAEWFEKFDGKDWSYQAVFTGVTAIDWAQTRTFHHYRSEGIDRGETNPILGRYPSSTAIDTYMVSAIALHGLVSWALPKKIAFNNGFNLYPRRIWQVIWIGIETKQVYDNYQLGVRLHF